MSRGYKETCGLLTTHLLKFFSVHWVLPLSFSIDVNKSKTFNLFLTLCSFIHQLLDIPNPFLEFQNSTLEQHRGNTQILLYSLWIISKSCLSRPYPFKFFKGCLPQILLGPFLNTLYGTFFNYLITIKFLSLGAVLNQNLTLTVFSTLNANDKYMPYLPFGKKTTNETDNADNLLLLNHHLIKNN